MWGDSAADSEILLTSTEGPENHLLSSPTGSLKTPFYKDENTKNVL